MPVELLAARAQPAAHLDGAADAAVLRVVEERHGRRRRVAGAVAQVRRQRRRVDDLAGIEDALRVERALDRAERLVQHRAEHLLHERAAHEAVAVLARQRAAELEHEIGDVVGDGFELPHALFGLQVHHRPDVQAADRRVRVHAGATCRGAATSCEKPVDVVAQLLGRHGGVLDEGERLRVALSSPSRGRGRPRAGSRFAPAPAGRARSGSDSRGRAPAGPARAPAAAAADPPPDRRRTPRTAARRARPR